MRRIIKNVKLCGAIIAMLLIVMSEKAVVFADESEPTEEELDMFQKILDYYESDPEFEKMYENNPDRAYEYIWKLVYDKLQNDNANSLRYTNSYGTVAYCTVPVKTQSTNSNCSAATLLQTMYGLGKQGNIYGTIDAAKMSTLYNYYNDPTAPGARQQGGLNDSLLAYEIADYLDNQITIRLYSYYQGANMLYSTFKNKVWDSLVYNRPVLLHAVTDTLPYYNGNTYYHYLSVDYYDKSADTMRIKDCHYDSTYGGSHIVTTYQAYGTIHRQGRYLISY
ncbi:MAG: hypothetical protein IJJ74_06145 [Eubacterium sp.]|nr:hypothetical protein [Eubacterium sp.]